MRKVQIIDRNGKPIYQCKAYAIMTGTSSVSLLVKKDKGELGYYRPRTVEGIKKQMDKKLIYKDDIVDKSIETAGGYFEGYYKDYKWNSWGLGNGKSYQILDSTNDNTMIALKKEEEIV